MNKYEAALAALRTAFERTDLGLDGWLHGIGAIVADHRQTYLEALQLAQEADQSIKAEPHEEYEMLRRQFMSLRSLANNQIEQLSFYSKKNYLLSEAKLAELEKSLDSEKQMNAILTQEAEQLRKDNERLVRENEVYAERHKAWESCVYAVGLPRMKSVRDTEYGDAVPAVPVVNKITDLLGECFELRKERDLFVSAYDPRNIGKFDLLKEIKAKAMEILANEILAKKVSENGNA